MNELSPQSVPGLTLGRVMLGRHGQRVPLEVLQANARPIGEALVSAYGGSVGKLA